MNIPQSPNPRIVIIGGGFAGIALAKKLRNKHVQVVLLDKHNYHTFQPLLYQVATGGLEAGSIAYPIRKVIQEYRDFYFRLTSVKEIDTVNQKVIAEIGDILGFSRNEMSYLEINDIISLPMKSTVIKVWNKRTDVSNPIHSPMSKADAVVLDSVHVDGKISLYCIEYVHQFYLSQLTFLVKHNALS